MKTAQACKPKLIIAGASAYSRTIDNGRGFLQTVAGRMWLAPGVGKVRDERSVKVEDTAGALIDIREEQLELVDGGDIRW